MDKKLQSKLPTDYQDSKEPYDLFKSLEKNRMYKDVEYILNNRERCLVWKAVLEKQANKDRRHLENNHKTQYKRHARGGMDTLVKSTSAEFTKAKPVVATRRRSSSVKTRLRRQSSSSSITSEQFEEEEEEVIDDGEFEASEENFTGRLMQNARKLNLLKSDAEDASKRKMSRAGFYPTEDPSKSIIRVRSFSIKRMHGAFRGLRLSGSIVPNTSGTVEKKEEPVKIIKPTGRFKRIAKTVAIAASFVKWMGRILYNPMEVGWDYDPATHMQSERKQVKKTFKQVEARKMRNSISGPLPKSKSFERSGSQLNVHNVVRSAFKATTFSGWLTPDMRDLFRKPIWSRTDADIKEMQRWCSSMKAFRRFTEPVQKALLKVARYDRWHFGRVLIKEGHKPMFFFIILDGEVEIFGKDKDQYANAYNAKKDEILQATGRYRNALLHELERPFIKVFRTMGAGDSFGDLAFRPGGSRTASIKTRRTTEVLLVERSEYEQVMAEAFAKTGNVDAQRRFEMFADTSELFSSLKFDKKALTAFCDTRTFAPNATIVCEGEDLSSIWFIRSGTARVLKLLHFIKETLPSGKTLLHILPAKYQQTDREGQFRLNAEEIIARRHVSLSNQYSKFCIVSKLSFLQTLGPGAHFGETNGIVAGVFEDHGRRRATLSKAQAEEEVRMDDDWFGKNCNYPARVSIVASSKVEIIGVNKIEFHKNSSSKTWKHLAIDRINRWTVDEIMDSYSEHRRWKNYCRAQVMSLLNFRKTQQQLLRYY